MTRKLNRNLIKLVNLLNDHQYHDGTSLGETLKMTRSAVWKAIQKLSQRDILIHSIKGRGYALLEPLALLDSRKIKKQLSNTPLDIHLFESVSSTNDYLKQNKQNKKNPSAIQICLAEQQLQGRGRLGREWHSPFGKNIYLSCLYPFQKDVSELAGLSLVTSLAIIKTLKIMGVTQHLHVKWPNDIVYATKKLAGCLVEIQAETHGMSDAIIGIGINVNMLNAEGHIHQEWTSLQSILGKYIDRNDLCVLLLQQLLNYLREFDRKGFSAFINEWVQTDCLAHQIITVKNIADKITGKVIGINTQGHLLLELEDGAIRAFSSGDTTILKKNNHPTF